MSEDTPMKIDTNHIQTALTGLLLAGVIWIMSSVNSLQQTVAVLEVEVRLVNEKFETIQANTFDASDAAAQLEIRDLKIDQLEARVERLESPDDL